MQNETRRRREDKSNGKRLILRTVPLASEETESSYVPRHHLKKKTHTQELPGFTRPSPASFAP